jgi:hypothetical protein
MRALFRSAICLLLATSAVAAETESEPIAESAYQRTGRAFLPEQGCSLVVGKGWRKQSEGDTTTLMVPGKHGSASNIILHTWETTLTIDAMAKDAAAKMVPKGYTVGDPEKFATFTKLEGLRLKAKEPNGRLIGIQYLFPAGEGLVTTLTGTFDPKTNADFERELNLCVKTFHLLDRPHNLPAELGRQVGDKRAMLRVPLGWETRADVVAMNSFAPPVIHHGEQLFVTLEKNAAPLHEFVAADANSDGSKRIKMEKADDFITEEGGKGFKARGFVKAEDGRVLRTATYYFDGIEGLKVVVRGAAEPSEWPAIESLFDSCVKTLRIGK